MRIFVLKEKEISSLLEQWNIENEYIFDSYTLLNVVRKGDVVFVQDDLFTVKLLNEQDSEINIFFISKSRESAYEALQEHVCGYLILPLTKDNIVHELNFLRYTNIKQTYIHCFGKFEVIVDGKPLHFHRKKAKELLAYLVMNKGELVTSDEIAEFFFGEANAKTNNAVYQTRFVLMNCLKEAGLEDIVKKEEGCFRIDRTVVECDYYRYLKGEKYLYHNEFMTQYAWAREYLEQ